MTRVSPLEAYALLRDAGYAYLDVRSVPEFDAGHPEGAFNVPWLEAMPGGMRANIAFVEQVSASFPREAKLVLGCQGSARAEQAARALIDAGFCEVVIQRAGMGGVVDPFGRIKEPGWRACGLPVALQAVAGRAHDALAMRAADLAALSVKEVD